MTKIVVNRCYGGFHLSEKAYEKLIEYGVPVRRYVKGTIDPDTGRYKSEPESEGEVIFDRSLSPDDEFCQPRHIRLLGRYWETWISDNRSHPLLLKVVEDLGPAEASGRFAELEIVEIPDHIEWEIEEYDGFEHVAEKHQTW